MNYNLKQNLANVRILFLIGSILISTLAMILVVASILFWVNVGISQWHFPVSFILTALFYFYFAKHHYQETRTFFISFCLCIGIIIVSILIALSFYDLSYDGQTYHMETIALLKNGWIPFGNLLPQKNELYLYINHYPKGFEIPQSAIYSFVGRIEAGKSTNLILLVATFCVGLSFLLKVNKLPAYKNILICLFAVGNPVILNQLISTYVDGSMALLILAFLITSVTVVKRPSLENLILLGSIIVITANLKFNSLVYIVILAAALLVWVVFTKNKVLLRRVFYSIMFSGSIAVLLVGFHPYLMNTIDFKHPFYPLMGDDSVDIITNNIPKSLDNMSSTGRFFTSFFAHTDNMMNDHDRDAKIKIPFTLNKVDILSAGKVDTRVAGFGPLFSGIFILSLLLFIVFLWRFKNLYTKKSLFYILLVLLFSILIMPDSWWARYVPQLWFIPVIFLLSIELYHKHSTKFFKITKYLVYLAFIINISFTFIGFGWNFVMSRLVDYQLETLKASKKPIKVQWGVCSTNYIRFQENNISFIEADLKDEENIEKIVRSNNSIFVIDPNVNVSKSKFIRWAEKYQQPEEEF